MLWLLYGTISARRTEQCGECGLCYRLTGSIAMLLDTSGLTGKLTANHSTMVCNGKEGGCENNTSFTAVKSSLNKDVS
jgi:hypothetical protein